MTKRKSPIRHKVRSHIRNGKHIGSYSRGSGTSKRERKVVGRSIECPTTPEGRPGTYKRLPSGVHTGGVKKLDGKVAKPLVGRQKRVGEPDILYPTHEYEAIKDLEDLPHIPKGVTKKEIDGVPHLIRNDLIVLEESDMRSLRREDLVSIEKTIREANKRGWSLNDTVQLGYDTEHGEYVIYDWSASMKYEPGSTHADDSPLIDIMWKEAGFDDYIKAKDYAFAKRINYNFKEKDPGDPYLRHTYLTYGRPPGVWMDLPKDSHMIFVEKDEPWKPLGIIMTREPLTRDKVEAYELTPTEHYREGP